MTTAPTGDVLSLSAIAVGMTAADRDDAIAQVGGMLVAEGLVTDGQHTIATGDKTGAISLIDGHAAPARIIRTLRQDSSIDALTFDPKGQILVAAGANLVGFTMLQTRAQVGPLIQVQAHIQPAEAAASSA